MEIYAVLIHSYLTILFGPFCMDKDPLQCDFAYNGIGTYMPPTFVNLHMLFQVFVLLNFYVTLLAWVRGCQIILYLLWPINSP